MINMKCDENDLVFAQINHREKEAFDPWTI